MEIFNPNDVGVANGNFFGLPYTLEECDIALVSVPWDATVSYAAGTSKGPAAMVEASLQVDLFDEIVPQAWNTRIGTVPADGGIEELNVHSRRAAEAVIAALENGEEADPHMLARVNAGSARINAYVEETAGTYLDRGKVVGVVGGEHSVPFGLLKAVAARHAEFGVLHIDAHADLRDAYEGFEFSHASIMFNTLKHLPQVKALTQVAVRDFCSDEYAIMTGDPRVKAFTDHEIARCRFSGENWKDICDRIVDTLPDEVYVSFDIDGLSPDLCPSTGTPVPGGLSFREADYLLERLAGSGRKIIAFDLCEVAPSADSEWDANVGARVLFKLCQWVKMTLDK